MPDSATLAFIALVFVLAGFVKGVIGLGLPTIGMGLLAVVMAPVQAAAILVLPSLVTNVWQMVRGPALGPLLRRLWPMLLGVSCGTWGAAGLMTGAYARHGAIALGVLAASGVHQLLSREPSLEELFLAHYGAEASDGRPSGAGSPDRGRTDG